MSYSTLAATSESRATGAPTTGSHIPIPNEAWLDEKDELVEAACARLDVALRGLHTTFPFCFPFLWRLLLSMAPPTRAGPLLTPPPTTTTTTTEGLEEFLCIFWAKKGKTTTDDTTGSCAKVETMDERTERTGERCSIHMEYDECSENPNVEYD